MTFKELARGIAIFDRYVDADDEIAAAHDQLFVCGTPPQAMLGEHVVELESLGWRWGSEDCWEHAT
jgi:hypothetical protein